MTHLNIPGTSSSTTLLQYEVVTLPLTQTHVIAQHFQGPLSQIALLHKNQQVFSSSYFSLRQLKANLIRINYISQGFKDLSSISLIFKPWACFKLTHKRCCSWSDIKPQEIGLVWGEIQYVHLHTRASPTLCRMAEAFCNYTSHLSDRAS